MGDQVQGSIHYGMYIGFILQEIRFGVAKIQTCVPSFHELWQGI